MKQQIIINDIRRDKAIMLAKEYDNLNKRLDSINAQLKEYVIEYDDSLTDRQDIYSILYDVLGIKT